MSAIMSGYSEFSRLVAETQASLRGFVRTLGVSPDAVDDVSQEAYLVAFRRFDEFDKDRDFLSWVRGIAKHLVLNDRRKDFRRQRILNEYLTDVLLEEGADSSPNPMDIEKWTAALAHCFEQLTETNRTLLRERYEGQMNASDLARRTNSTSVGVRQVLFKIRRFIQACIEAKVGEAWI